jgi:hypothetical protein
VRPSWIFLLGLVAMAGAAARAADGDPVLKGAPAGFSFAGRWSCAGAFGNGQPHRSSYEGKIGLGGRWLELSETDLQPAGYVATYLIGMAGDGTHILDFDVNNFGSARYESPGWDGSSLTLSSVGTEGYAKPAPDNRFVYSAVSKSRFEVTWQVKGPSGWPTGGDHLICDRTEAG